MLRTAVFALFALLAGHAAMAQVFLVNQPPRFDDVSDLVAGLMKQGVPTPEHHLVSLLKQRIDLDRPLEALRPGQILQPTELIIREGQLFASGSRSALSAIRDVLAQARAARPRQAQVQFSVITLPAALLQQQRITGPIAVLTEPAAGELFRAALAAGGTLHNLPELRSPSLLPFEVAPPPRGNTPAWQVRGSAVVLDASTAMLSVQLAEAKVAQPTIAERTFRLPVEGNAVITQIDGDRATALWVRLAALPQAPALPAAPIKEQQPKPQPDK